MARYILAPGWVRSRTDGDLHYIDAPRLARLYGVPLHSCLVRRNPDLRQLPEGAVILRPRADGDYRLPQES